MIHRYYKNFTIFGFEKIAEWLNSMSEKGLQLVEAGFFMYCFEDGIPGEYFYAVEPMTRSIRKDPNYFDFLEELKIERIPSTSGIIFYRRKAKEGEFNLYNDLGPVIKRYRTASISLYIILITQIFLLATIVRSYFITIELNRSISEFSEKYPDWQLDPVPLLQPVFMILSIVLITFLVLMLIKTELTIRQLKKEKMLQG